MLQSPNAFATKLIRSASGTSAHIDDAAHISAFNAEHTAKNLQECTSQLTDQPSAGGVGTARAIARAYSEFATDGHNLGLRPETMESLKAPAIPSERGFFDECMRGDIEFSLGFMKSCKNMPFGHAGAFGSPGAGGSLGYADPQTRTAYAYVTRRMEPALKRIRETSP